MLPSLCFLSLSLSLSLSLFLMLPSLLFSYVTVTALFLILQSLLSLADVTLIARSFRCSRLYAHPSFLLCSLSIADVAALSLSHFLVLFLC